MDSPATQHVRGTALAVAQDWLIRLPDGPEKQQAIDFLDMAAVLACEAFWRSTYGQAEQPALQDDGA